MTKEEFKNQIVLNISRTVWEKLQTECSDDYIAGRINRISDLIVDKCYENNDRN